MTKPRYDEAQLGDLLLQMMETELGGEQVYRTALTCAVNEELKEEWQGYLDETLSHQNVVRTTCELLGVDADEEVPSRAVVRHIGNSLVKAMELALKAGNATAAQLVACECVVHAETKDHANWELLGKVAEVATGETRKVLKDAHSRVEKDEDHHLYHTKGWCRELWIQSLGMPAVLPPPEEVRQVETAIGASRAEQQRKSML
ncbi:hypothetical protein ACUTR7_03580 [Delftia sp. NA_296.1]|jgi:hypothetical protein|uniref:hypothetical protein n=1 Tax=Delftia TaxID=80865 RepID=UPI001C0E499D|nr:hypothetical protein [Delftia acidovorans]MCA1066948.1 hypothetical protein [Delftia acidovorans]